MRSVSFAHRVRFIVGIFSKPRDFFKRAVRRARRSRARRVFPFGFRGQPITIPIAAHGQAVREIDRLGARTFSTGLLSANEHTLIRIHHDFH
jgi:hypothetical protein